MAIAWYKSFRSNETLPAEFVLHQGKHVETGACCFLEMYGMPEDNPYIAHVYLELDITPGTIHLIGPRMLGYDCYRFKAASAREASSLLNQYIDEHPLLDYLTEWPDSAREGHFAHVEFVPGEKQKKDAPLSSVDDFLGEIFGNKTEE